MKPGEILFGDGPIVLNPGRPSVELEVENSSANPVWISSHYPFVEVNRRLVFDRSRAWGLHLDVPAGDAVGWRPGESKRVRLVPYAGTRTIVGFNGITEGPATPERLPDGMARVVARGFGHRPEPR